ncbi:uncharacterized protein LOC100845986 [Brachypodium distachyon]|uniref:uncharacterized protein LOC100845986 n=1 Tax=Brachypodium distachyon TaxID=15368 RepID=UPI000D0DAAB1|nr:uncharacterized protein LOC100845986 [Brachypodium distachyon]|eukprot:XP_024314592.1 uncharacterized protein LOC100845986 [Brachypodium distachyon]
MEGMGSLFNIVSRILSDHPGPACRFHFDHIRLHKSKKRSAEEDTQIESWFRSRALANLEELDIFFVPFGWTTHAGTEKRFLLPSSVFHITSALVRASFGYCDFPNEVAHAIKFPLLKRLTLHHVSISDNVFSRMLSGCHVQETLHLEEMRDVPCLHITSSTLRSIGTSNLDKCELIIQDAPRLERLLLSCPGDETIRVIRAPKLEILGLLWPGISEIKIANLVFQGTNPASLKNPIRTVTVLALEFSRPNLDAVLEVLRCFPSLEKLYVNRETYMLQMKNVHPYDPLDPIECLENHLKKLVFRGY